jgi:hypothetical protein
VAIGLTLLAACLLAVVHVFAAKLRFLDVAPRSRWLSAAGGISVAYVFLHLLPELAEGQRILQQAVTGLFRYLEHHAYLVAFLGLVMFYGLERMAKMSRRRQLDKHAEDLPGASVFWLHMASFSLYNLLVGYLLVRDLASLRELWFFVVAMALHFVVTDSGLREHHKHMFTGMGRWILALAVLGGWVLGVSLEIPELATSLLVAFLAGGIILNVLKEELPEERQSRFSAFLFGGITYAALLLV